MPSARATLRRLTTVSPARRRQWRRLLRRHRRTVTAALCALGVLTTVQAVAPSPPPTVQVLVTAHDLDGAEPLTREDLAWARLPPSAVPARALVSAGQALARTLAGPMTRGEPLTADRLVGPGLVDALGPGLVATPVRVADAEVAALVQAGDRVDVLAAAADPSSGRGTTVTASDVRVLTVPPAAADSAAGGALVVLATTLAQATALATAETADRLSLTLRGEQGDD